MDGRAVPGDGEQPRGQPCVVAQERRAGGEPQPGLLQQVLGNLPAVGETQQEAEETRAVGVEGLVEGGRLPALQARNQVPLQEVPHSPYNALREPA
jgi:hypothetical protein